MPLMIRLSSALFFPTRGCGERKGWREFHCPSVSSMNCIRSPQATTGREVINSFETSSVCNIYGERLHLMAVSSTG